MATRRHLSLCAQKLFAHLFATASSILGVGLCEIQAAVLDEIKFQIPRLLARDQRCIESLKTLGTIPVCYSFTNKLARNKVKCQNELYRAGWIP